MDNFTPQLRIEDLPQLNYVSTRDQEIAADATNLLNTITQGYSVSITNGIVEPDLVNQVTANHNINGSLHDHLDRPVHSYYNSDLYDTGIRSRYYVRTTTEDTPTRSYPMEVDSIPDLRTTQWTTDTDRLLYGDWLRSSPLRNSIIDLRTRVKCGFEVFDGYLSNDTVEIEVLIKPDEKTLAFLNKVYNFVWEDKQ